MLQKVRKQGIRFWDERTFWHEIIYKSLIPTFGSLQYRVSEAHALSQQIMLVLTDGIMSYGMYYESTYLYS